MSEEGLRRSEEKMRAAGVPDVAIATFRHYYRQLEAGATGMLPESEIEPVESLPDAGDLPTHPPARQPKTGQERTPDEQHPRAPSSLVAGPGRVPLSDLPGA